MKVADRPPADMVIAGLETTSKKIRKLAKAGYLRTEIADFLEIRYQHVRKVLVDAGISDGLQRDAPRGRQSASRTADLEPVKEVSWEILFKAGFQLLGEWSLTHAGEIELDAKASSEPGVYAFVLDDVIAYIGQTQTGLRTRLDHYRRGHAGQKTSARVKKLITDALAAGKRVKVLTVTPESLEWNSLPVNTAAGLEAGLIQMIRPAWNIQGAS